MNKVVSVIVGMYHDVGLNLLSQYNFYVEIIKSDNMPSSFRKKNKVCSLIVRYPLTNLGIICAFRRGIDNINIKYVIENNILMMNNPKISAFAIAEHTIGSFLGLSKKILFHHSKVKNNNYFVRNTINKFDINNKIIRIVGLRSIVSKVSSIC